MVERGPERNILHKVRPIEEAEREQASQFFDDLITADRETFRSNLQKARENGSINTVTLAQQKEIVRRLALELQEDINKEIGNRFMAAIEVERLLMPPTRSYDQADIVDVFMKLIPELYLQCPEAAHELSNLLDQNGQMVDPDVTISTYAELINHPALPDSARFGALSGLYTLLASDYYHSSRAELNGSMN